MIVGGQQARHHRLPGRTFPASPAAPRSTRARTARTSARPKSSSTAAAASQMISRGSLAENGPSLEQVGEFSVVSQRLQRRVRRLRHLVQQRHHQVRHEQVHRAACSITTARDSLNARSRSSRRRRPKYKQHEGGFTLGGPVTSGLRRPRQDVLLRQPWPVLLARRLERAT